MAEIVVPDQEYWKGRFKLLEEASHRATEDVIDGLQAQIQRSIDRIDEQIEVFIRRYAVNDHLSVEDAKAYLTEGEFANYKMDLDEYIRLGQENAMHFSADVARDLERASLEYRTTRLAALQTRLKAEAANIYGLTEEITYQTLGELYPELYCHSAFEIYKGLGYINLDFVSPNLEMVELLLKTPWTNDGKTFSARLWENQTALINELVNTLSMEFLNGDSVQEATRNLQKVTGKPLFQCKRLIYTETAYFLGLAEHNCFLDNDIQRYVFHSELALDVCDTCQKLDGRIFNEEDRMPGVNAPPIHPLCRCDCFPYITENEIPGYVDIGRMGRNAEGKSQMMPPGMTYDEWYQEYGQALQERRNRVSTRRARNTDNELTELTIDL